MIRKTTKEQLLSILQMMLKLHHTKEMENGKTQRKLFDTVSGISYNYWNYFRGEGRRISKK